MKEKQKKRYLQSYAWSAPSLVLIGLMVVFPILYTFYISLTNMNVYHWFDFTVVGLDNYVRALFVFDSGFLSALLATVGWTAVNMVLQLVIAFVLANLLNIRQLRLRKLYKTILMFPWAMPGYVGILLWKTGMFNTQFGLLNQWMQRLGFAAVRWLASDISAFLCCTVVNLWLALCKPGSLGLLVGQELCQQHGPAGVLGVGVDTHELEAGEAGHLHLVAAAGEGGQLGGGVAVAEGGLAGTGVPGAGDDGADGAGGNLVGQVTVGHSQEGRMHGDVGHTLGHVHAGVAGGGGAVPVDIGKAPGLPWPGEPD